MKLSLVWTRHIRDPEKKLNFEKTIAASTTMRERLLEILSEEEAQIEASSVSIKDFENASWAYKQAFVLGEKAIIKKFRDLLELKDKE